MALRASLLTDTARALCIDNSLQWKHAYRLSLSTQPSRMPIRSDSVYGATGVTVTPDVYIRQEIGQAA